VRLSRVICWLFASLMIILLAPSAIAQQDQDFETGLNPYATYQSGNIDSINVLNRGLNVDIPLISYPQRGGKLNLDFDLHYINQGNWFNCTPGTNCSGYYGSGQALINGFAVILKNWPSTWGTRCQSTGDQYGDWTCQGSATMFDGSVHSMLPITVSNWESDDTSGLQLGGFDLQAGNNPPLLIDANGTRYNQTYTPSYFPGPVGGESYLNYVPTLVEDANGNEITYSQTAGWTDTMGRTIPLPASASISLCPQQSPLLMPVAAYTWSLPGVSGGTYKLTFCYVNVPVTVNWDMQILHTTEEELQTVMLPNNTSWTFQYTTDGNGDLSQITFPTGGTLSYTWTTEDPLCAAYYYSNARAVVTRTLNPNDGVSPAGTWTYSYISNVNPVVTDPASNDTVHTFSSLITNACPYYETVTKYYQGSHSSGTLLKTVNTTYQALWSSSTFATGLGQPSQTTSLWANGQENETAYTYDSALNFHAPDYVSSTEFSTHMGGVYPPASYGLVETKKDYDYKSGVPTSVLKTTTTSYEALANSNYLTNNMLALPASVAVTGSGPGSTTTYTYDQTTPVSSGITTMHNSSPPGGTYRGNPTTVSRYLNTTGTYLNTTSTIYDTGMVHVVTDPKSNNTTYLYSPTYVGAYLTSETNALGQTTTFAYDFNSGSVTSTTDPNNQTTSATYDEMWRPLSISYPDNGETTYSYNDASLDPTVTTTKLATPSPSITSGQTFDGLGRPYKTQITSVSPAITNYMTYDALGRVYSVYNPTGCNPPTTNCGESTWGYSLYAYDALSRLTKIIEQDNSPITYTYTGSCTTVTDEAGRTWERCTDGLGRMTEVIENPGGLGYVTTYSYDALNDLVGVTQDSSRPRSFVYDSLSRLTSSTNPENGQIKYTYDSDGNVQTRTDARGIVTTYTVDAVNRITQKAYSDNTTPTAQFLYDTASTNGVVLANPIGRLSRSNTSVVESLFSYDPVGRVVTYMQTTPEHNSIAFSPSYTYDLAGHVTSFTNGLGVTFSYSVDGAGRTTQVAGLNDPPQYPEVLAAVNSSTGFWPNSAVRDVLLGNGLTQTSVLNNRLQPCRLNVNSSATALGACTAAIPSGSVQDFNYQYGTPEDNGNVWSWTAVGQQTFSRSYTYDMLNRLSTMSDSATNQTCKGLSWVYDAWGNRTAQNVTSGTCVAPQTPVNTNNQLSTSGYTYDAAGNLTADGFHTYTYDAENRLTTVDGGSTATYSYDAIDHRVEKTTSAGYLDYLYDLAGNVEGEWQVISGYTGPKAHYAYMNGGLVSEYIAGTTYFVHTDHLGSTRLVTGVTQSLIDNMDYLPYGEQISGSSSISHKFTDKERDPETASTAGGLNGLDNFEARYMTSRLGRFMSPNSIGGRPAFPQSWNAYSYVLDNPLSAIDPNGLDCVYLNASGNDIELIDNDSDPLTCQQTGGAWAPGTLTGIEYDSNSNDVLLAYANLGEDGSIDYGQITAAPGQFNPGDQIYGLAADINQWNIEANTFKIYGIGAAIGATGGTICYVACGSLGIGTVTTLGATVGGTAGPLVTDPDLEAWVEEMYQATDKVPGGLAGAVRYEARTGILLSPAGHFQEASEILGHINELIRNGGLSVHDQVVAKSLAEDLSQSLDVARSWGAIK
jgi:RHS repeat-associated protein